MPQFAHDGVSATVNARAPPMAGVSKALAPAMSISKSYSEPRGQSELDRRPATANVKAPPREGVLSALAPATRDKKRKALSSKRLSFFIFYRAAVNTIIILWKNSGSLMERPFFQELIVRLLVSFLILVTVLLSRDSAGVPIPA